MLPVTSQLEGLLHGLRGSWRCGGNALSYSNVPMAPVPSGSTFNMMSVASAGMKG